MIESWWAVGAAGHFDHTSAGGSWSAVGFVFFLFLSSLLLFFNHRHYAIAYWMFSLALFPTIGDHYTSLVEEWVNPDAHQVFIEQMGGYCMLASNIMVAIVSLVLLKSINKGIAVSREIKGGG